MKKPVTDEQTIGFLCKAGSVTETIAEHSRLFGECHDSPRKML